MGSQSTYHRKRGRLSLTRIVQYSILILVVIIVILPVLLNAMGGMKTRGEYMARPYTIPIPPKWDNYIYILKSSSFWLMLWNSLLVMIGATGGVVLFCSMAAFVFARLKFRGLNLIFNIYTLGLMFPINIAILPVFLTLRQAGLTNTLLAVIIVQIVYQLSGNILILRNFFRAIPIELQDAAYLDGCNAFDFYWRILLPLALPSLAAVAALTMIVSWNDLLVPLVVLDKEPLWTLPLGTMQFQSQYGLDLSLIAAFVTLSAIPPILFYLLAERQIVSGLTAGSLKG
jgi:raffinose/stachyose/melibiose transport system permease protein